MAPEHKQTEIGLHAFPQYRTLGRQTHGAYLKTSPQAPHLMPSSDADQLQRRNRELSILNTIAQDLNRSLDLNETLSIVLARVANLLDLKTGWIWLLDEEHDEPYLAAVQNLPPALADNPYRLEGDCYCLDTYKAGNLDGAANINVVTCSRLKHLLDGTEGLRYHASIPLYAHGKQLGVLNVASTDWRELSSDDLRLLYTVGDLLSIAVERARLFARSTKIGMLEERNRLAREIHDTLAQDLAAITLQLETADALLDAGVESERICMAIQKALLLSQISLDEVRRSVLDLRAAPLEGRTLAQALQALVERWRSETGIPVHFEIVGGNTPLPISVETGLYRIAQEALNNIERHADANQVTLRLLVTPDEIRLDIEDDGRGFKPGQSGGNSFGLVGMNERTKLLGGRMSIESNPGQGTRLEIVLPRES